MIHTDQTGEAILKELFNALDSFGWTPWERKFLEDIQYKGFSYRELSRNQRNIISDLYDKLLAS